MEVRLVQPEKALLPIVFAELKLAVFKLVHP